MFKAGDIIVYSAQGVCKIDRIEKKQIGKNMADYYVLKPLYNDNTVVFVPADNQQLTAKMQCVLTKTQAENLIKKAPDIDIINSNNEDHKREQYKVILSSGDREQLVALIKTIRFEKENRCQCGKKLNLNDEQTLKKAELLLFNEMAFIYDTTPDEIRNMMIF